jgi:hypothetical protein
LYILLDHEQKKDKLFISEHKLWLMCTLLKNFMGPHHCLLTVFQRQDCHADKSNKMNSTMVSLSIMPSQH